LDCLQPQKKMLNGKLFSEYTKSPATPHPLCLFTFYDEL
jgi:hypothetical protein